MWRHSNPWILAARFSLKDSALSADGSLTSHAWQIANFLFFEAFCCLVRCGCSCGCSTFRMVRGTLDYLLNLGFKQAAMFARALLLCVWLMELMNLVIENGILVVVEPVAYSWLKAKNCSLVCDQAIIEGESVIHCVKWKNFPVVQNDCCIACRSDCRRLMWHHDNCFIFMFMEKLFVALL